MASVVISRKDLERMKESVLPVIEDKRDQTRRAELRQKSQERLKKWPNTLEATRKNKESFLKDREDKAEMDRQEVDKQEAEFRRENRLATIKKANEMIYDQTDKMKMLRSQRLYADVIHTRQSQIEKKAVDAEREAFIEQKFHVDILEQVRRGDEVERQKAQKVKDAMDVIKVTRKQQLDDNRRVRDEIARKDKEEGIRMKEEAKARLSEAVQEEKNRMQIIRDANFRTLEASKKDSLLKLKIKEQEEAAVLGREAEVGRIDERKRAIKERTDEMFTEAQQTRMQMIERAVENLNRQSSSEQTILNQQMDDQRAKEDKAILDKEEKTRLEWEETVRSRTVMTRKRAEDKLQEKTFDDKLAAKWKKENEDAIQEAKDKKVAAKMEQTRIKLLQLEEGHRVNAEKELTKKAEIEQTRFLVSLQGNDDKKFTEACKAEIEKNVRLGKPVYTLLRALEFTQPQLLAAKTMKGIKKKVDEE